MSNDIKELFERHSVGIVTIRVQGDQGFDGNIAAVSDSYVALEKIITAGNPSTTYILYSSIIWLRFADPA